MGKETPLSKDIRTALERMGCWVQRLNSGSVRVRGGWYHGCEPGTPDLAIWAPSFGFLEVKLPDDRSQPNENQVRWHERAKQRGVRIAVVRSVREAIEIVENWKEEQEER